MEWLAALSNFGAMGIVLLFFLKVHYDVITRFLPSLIEDVKAELKDERDRREKWHQANSIAVEHLAQKLDKLADAFATRIASESANKRGG